MLRADNIGIIRGSAPKPSALRVAIVRAVHQLLDVSVVFEDALALRILGAAEQAALRSDPVQYNSPRFKGLRASVVVRSRVAEEEWDRSKARGVGQYVILGAGLDTFAYRNQDDGRSRIFEVDLPATQRWKRDCLRVAGIKEPARLTYVPVDFERCSLAERLEEAGFRRSESAALDRFAGAWKRGRFRLRSASRVALARGTREHGVSRRKSGGTWRSLESVF